MANATPETDIKISEEKVEHSKEDRSGSITEHAGSTAPTSAGSKLPVKSGETRRKTVRKIVHPEVEVSLKTEQSLSIGSGRFLRWSEPGRR